MEIKCRYSEIKDITSLVPNPNNPNKHTDQQIEMLAKIMKFQGVRSPIVVSTRSGFITKGHGRLEAIKLNGWREAPVEFQDYENEAQEYADMVADNEIARLAKPDMNMIIDFAKDLPESFDFDLLGIPDFQLPEVFEPQCDEDAVPEQVDTRCKTGDLWQLGNHRLLCGDSTNIQHVERLMGAAKSDLVMSDPPYNVNYGADGNKNPAGWTQKRDRTIMNDHMSGDEFREFCRGWIGCISVVHSGCIYVWGPPGPDGRIMFTELDLAFHCSTTGVWVKDRLVLGRGKYHNRYEPCWFGWNTDGANFVDDRNLTNVWEFNRPHKSDLHPTMKPVELIETLIKQASRPSQVVLDLFGGSGTTLVACEKTNRKCFMMEIDPHYCDVILARWEKYTGKKAELL